MAAEFPGIKELQAAYRARRPADTDALRPEPPDGLRPAWGTLGQGIDHRLRYAFSDQDGPSSAVSSGMVLAAAGPNQTVIAAIGSAADGLRAALADLISHERPADRSHGLELAADAEEHLLRICYAMAWFEEVYRTGRLWPGTPLGEADGNLTATDLLAAVPTYAVADLRAQVHLAAGCLSELRAVSAPGQVQAGPVFTGSRDVGGADADVIINDLLLEVKASTKAVIKREGFYQLIGYLLLDYNDVYRIRRVGLYLVRFGHLVTWTVPELLVLLGAQHNLAELRKIFADTVADRDDRQD